MDSEEIGEILKTEKLYLRDDLIEILFDELSTKLKGLEAPFLVRHIQEEGVTYPAKPKVVLVVKKGMAKEWSRVAAYTLMIHGFTKGIVVYINDSFPPENIEIAVTLIHEILHAKNPELTENQVESLARIEAEKLGQ